jgi:hypothetical protein
MHQKRALKMKYYLHNIKLDDWLIVTKQLLNISCE